MIIYLERFSYSDTETEGVLLAGDHKLATIEQPWLINPNGELGGMPFHSCIPDGMYRLSPWTRPSGAECWIIWNPKLGVHKLPVAHEHGVGRDLCLIHKGNWASDVQGCIAPGLRRMPMAKNNVFKPAVGASKGAMELLHDVLGNREHLLSITSVTGTYS
jgi:hypothetical protein